MSSLKDSIAHLESDLKAVPPRINVYQDLPFAIMRYDATDEWALRREIKLLATRLEATGKAVHFISMSELLWAALGQVHEKDDDEGLDAIIALEQERRAEDPPGNHPSRNPPQRTGRRRRIEQGRRTAGRLSLRTAGLRRQTASGGQPASGTRPQRWRGDQHRPAA